MQRYTAASVDITGKRCDAKVSRTVWREADGKGLDPEHLAGGPPYPISRGGTAHSSAAHLTPTPSRTMGPTFADGTPCVMADAQRGYSRG